MDLNRNWHIFQDSGNVIPQFVIDNFRKRNREALEAEWTVSHLGFWHWLVQHGFLADDIGADETDPVYAVPQ